MDELALVFRARGLAPAQAEQQAAALVGVAMFTGATVGVLTGGLLVRRACGSWPSAPPRPW